jgi:hypothetical protein
VYTVQCNIISIRKILTEVFSKLCRFYTSVSSQYKTVTTRLLASENLGEHVVMNITSFGSNNTRNKTHYAHENETKVVNIMYVTDL